MRRAQLLHWCVALHSQSRLYLGRETAGLDRNPLPIRQQDEGHENRLGPKIRRMGFHQL